MLLSQQLIIIVASSYQAFKFNYKAITVANISAAKEARGNETDRLKELELNAYGNMTKAEYMVMWDGIAAPAAKPEKPSALKYVMVSPD